MNVVVTGAAGFLGSWLADTMVECGHRVVGVDSFIGGYRDNLKSCTCIEGDVTDLDAMTRAFTGADVVFHCAALAYEGLSVFSPKMIIDNIVGGSVSVMTAAIRNNVMRLVNCSSMARYGVNLTPYREAMTPAPVDPYGLAKWQAEQQLNLLGRIHGVQVVHAVPHNIIGPRQKYDDPFRNVVSIMSNRMLQGKQPIIYGDGSQVRCFSHVTDVLPILVQLLDCSGLQHGEVFNVGPDETPVTINRLAVIVAGILNVKLEAVHVDPRPCEIKMAWCSSDKIRQRFGYCTKTSLEEGVLSIVNYVKERGPRPFDYHLPLEIDGPRLPCTWKERLI